MNIKAALLSVFVLIPLFLTSAALADEAKKKEGDTTEKAAKQDKQLNVTTSTGSRSCSARSEDGKKSCSVSCKADEDAECSSTETEAECACK